MDKPMIAGETEPRAPRARTADSQLEPQNQEILRTKSFFISTIHAGLLEQPQASLHQ